MIKLNFHSCVDVITNSSTVIFTYSDGSDTVAKEMINELLKLMNSDLTADDMFYFGVFCDDEKYTEYENYEEDPFEQFQDIKK